MLNVNCATNCDYGVHRHVVFVDFRKTIKSCCWGVGAMRSYLGVFCFRDIIVITVVLQNFNEVIMDSLRCVFGEMLIN